MSLPHGPGITWLAARTGKDPSELLSSPVAALAEALRELARLEAQAGAGLDSLREEIAAAPPPWKAFLTRVRS